MIHLTKPMSRSEVGDLFRRSATVAHGVRLICVGEEGEFILAPGLVDTRRMVAAANNFACKVEGLDNLWDDPAVTYDDTASCVTYRDAAFFNGDPRDDPWDVYVDWSKDVNTMPSDYVHQITVLGRQ